MTQATISIEWVVTGCISLMVLIIGFFLSQKFKKLDKIDDMALEFRDISADFRSISEFIKDVKPKLSAIDFQEKRIDACFKRQDELKQELRSAQSTILGLRTRSHDLATWITSCRLKLEQHGEKFPGSWELAKINDQTKEND